MSQLTLSLEKNDAKLLAIGLAMVVFFGKVFLEGLSGQVTVNYVLKFKSGTNTHPHSWGTANRQGRWIPKPVTVWIQDVVTGKNQHHFTLPIAKS